MSYWVIEQLGAVDYDETAGFVIEAESEKEARDLAHEEGSHGFGGTWEGWLDPKLASCTELKCTGKTRVILIDYKAG